MNVCKQTNSLYLCDVCVTDSFARRLIKMSMRNDYTYKFIEKMPKVELHAHLNGSLSQNTLQKLMELKKKKDPRSEADLSIPCLTPDGDLSRCFQMFSLISKITDSPEAVYMATCDVIADFYNDGVRYLELRTTPKENDQGLTQEIYIETVLKAIEDTCSNACQGMAVKLLLSIDRKRPLEAAETTIKVAEKLLATSSAIIGIDLSGDPRSGDIKNFLPILDHAKKLGLKLAVHVAELPYCHEEVEQLLKLQPDRLGHGTFLHPLKKGSSINFELLKTLQAPLEICLTSNVACKTVSSYEDHHFQLFKELKYPCILCTDDKGIFNTTLSQEYYLASQYYSLSKEDLFNLSYESIDYAFCDESQKEELKKFWILNKNF